MPRNLCQMAIKKRIMTAKVIGYMEPDIDPNTRLYVPFNEGVGSVAKDYSQYGNHAQLTDVEWSPDGFNGAGKFNGSSSFGDCGNDASLKLTDAIMIKVWIKPATITGSRRICDKRGTGAGYILFASGTTLYMTVNEDHQALAAEKLTLNMWQHITGTYDKSLASKNIKIHHNGLEVGNLDWTETIVATTNRMAIGAQNPDSGVAYYFNGTIDNVIISSTAKSAAQIAADCYEVVCS